MGERGWVGESNYAASKGAINAFTRCCAVELARFGVRVNAVLPGFAPTELVGGLVEKDGGKGILKQIPMRSFATVEEVARVVTFLAGPDCQLHDRISYHRRWWCEHDPRGRRAALTYRTARRCSRCQPRKARL